MTAELLTYPFRRFGRWLRDPSMACRYRLCPEPQVGLSVWCREHTDRILAGEHASTWPRKEGFRCLF